MLCLCCLQMDKTYRFGSLALFQKELLNLNQKRSVVFSEIVLCSQSGAVLIVGHFTSVSVSNYYVKLCLFLVY